MQAIILAAGSGSRLGMDIPKPLIEIGGITIIERLIRQFREAGIEDIVMVVGYEADVLQETVMPLAVRTVFNPFYSVSDNLVSFWMGQSEVSQECIISHADLILEGKFIKAVMNAEGDIVLPLDRKSMDAEAMKMKIVDGELKALAKEIPLAEAAGESIPFMRFSPLALLRLKEISRGMVRGGDINALLEKAIQQLGSIMDFQINILDITGCKWVEIDTPADLEKARELFT